MYGITNAGGGSGTKSTLIISIDSGSTVQVYSNSTYTTLIKTATEKSAGQFWAKGLDNGTYYLKATKSGQTTTMEYTISEYGVYRIRMSYFHATITGIFPTTCTAVTLTKGTDTFSVPAEFLPVGRYSFTVYSAGTYTYSITNGIDTKTTTVSVSTDGQSVSVSLTFQLWLYDGSLGESGSDGANVCAATTGGWGSTKIANVTYDAAHLYGNYSSNMSIYTNNKIDLTNYSTLHFVGYQANGSSARHTVGASTGSTAVTTDFAASAVVPYPSSNEVTIDVSALTGEYYIKMYVAGNHNIYMTSCWLD